ncbi:hypothetical protein K0I73_05850 [Shewanella mesophila]|uniref:MFS transporter n=1 Tax=Shewanella mesophila TaxID=2864208 RepID=UPI001C65E81D|nr:MFS transporter [Shewanella mesophila]QYJ87233.1 hypothetical protein K0I73_05850 [Shewanella mesophila]
MGLILAGLLVDRLGHQGLFSFLVLISIVLWLMSGYLLIETKPNNLTPIPLWPLATCMFNDGKIWRCAILIACFNLMLFGYYSLAPFIFSELSLSVLVFGYSGIVLAFGTLLGSLRNKKLLMLGWQEKGLTLMASCLAMVGAIGVATLQTSLAFLIPMIAVVISFGIAILNILSSAIDDYKAMVGSAGALLGLTYYLLLGLSLLLASLIHDLGFVLLAASTVSLIVSIVQTRKAANLVDHTI